MLKVFKILLVAILLLMNSASTSAADWGNDYIEAEGVVYAEQGMSLNQMRRIAIVDAYRYLAEQVDTLYVTSNSTVKNLRELDEEINTKVEAALHGAKVAMVTRERDGSFHAIVRLPVYGSSQSLTAAVLTENTVVEAFPKPRYTNIHSEIHYTGLIIDCRGLNLSQAISPSIKSDEGLAVYSYKNLSYQVAVDKGMVEYSNTLNSKRAGTSPLVVKAVKISEKCDVVISADDADKVLAANRSSKFLDNCLIVLVR